MRKWLFGLIGLGLLSLLGCSGSGESEVEITNASYDPTRELYRDLDKEFTADYRQTNNVKVKVKQSHGGSGGQARAVTEGLEADVVTLALWNDVDAIAQKGLIDAGWEDRLPERSLPYYSTIVFVVRKGNPRGISDWNDLIRDDVQVITPNPKTSGNGRLTFLAAWGAVKHRKGTDDQARDFVTKLYQRVPVLDTGARGSTVTFAQKGIGDVQVTWENEAYLQQQESKGELEIVYPPVSIKAEPTVAVVNSVARRRGTEKVAEDYLKWLYTDRAQAIIARHHYRPSNKAILEQHRDELKPIELFPIQTCIEGGWPASQPTFFAEGAIFDQIYKPTGK